MLFINPEECIDCDACTSECPTEAIFQHEHVPAEWKGYIELNAEMVAVSPNITEKQLPLSGN